MTAATCIIVVQAFTRGLACNNHVKEWPMSFDKNQSSSMPYFIKMGSYSRVAFGSF